MTIDDLIAHTTSAYRELRDVELARAACALIAAAGRAADMRDDVYYRGMHQSLTREAAGVIDGNVAAAFPPGSTLAAWPRRRMEARDIPEERTGIRRYVAGSGRDPLALVTDADGGVDALAMLGMSREQRRLMYFAMLAETPLFRRTAGARPARHLAEAYRPDGVP